MKMVMEAMMMRVVLVVTTLKMLTKATPGPIMKKAPLKMVAAKRTTTRIADETRAAFDCNAMLLASFNVRVRVLLILT